MEFISFKAQGRSSYGTLNDGGVHDLGARIGSVLPDLKSYLRAISFGLLTSAPKPASGADYKLSEISFDPVIPNPDKIICVGANYEAHRLETGRAKPSYPMLFTRFADTLVGHRGTIALPKVSTSLDYEGELAFIIGRPAFRVPREKALEHVAGYTCFNDATLRDWQKHTSQFIPGKNFPGTAALGPALVTAPLDRLGDRKIETRLNTKVLQSAKLGEMTFSIPEIIAYVSSFTPLAPGDVIATGTPSGVGFTREPPIFMKAGDTIEVLIDGVGHLINVVKDETIES